MRKLLFVILLFTLTFKLSKSQINCYPQIGDLFLPIHKNVCLFLEPDSTSEVTLKSIDDEDLLGKGISLICVQDGFTKDFVKVKVLFEYLTIEDYGVNKNLYFLFDEIQQNIDSNLIFKSFYNSLNDSTQSKLLYEQIKKEDWFHEWSKSEISSFKDFYKFCIQNTPKNDSVNFILENYGKILYVHKSQIKTSDVYFLYFDPDKGPDYYINEVERFKRMKDVSSCQFNSGALLINMVYLFELLIKDKRYFDAIKQINFCEPYMVTDREKFKIDYLRMWACYLDKNISGALDFGKKIINSFKQQKVIHSSYFRSEDIDMSAVYKVVIYSLIELEKYEEGLKFSNEILLLKELQFEEFIEGHATLLWNLGKKEKACKFLNDEYLKGNDIARELFFKNCK